VLKAQLNVKTDSIAQSDCRAKSGSPKIEVIEKTCPGVGRVSPAARFYQRRLA
jgi:hypothetical protein